MIIGLAGEICNSETPRDYLSIYFKFQVYYEHNLQSQRFRVGPEV